jgi:hypothetical protein
MPDLAGGSEETAVDDSEPADAAELRLAALAPGEICVEDLASAVLGAGAGDIWDRLDASTVARALPFGSTKVTADPSARLIRETGEAVS